VHCADESRCTRGQGPSVLKNFGGDKTYCLRFDDVTMFTQPYRDLFPFCKIGKMELIYFGDHAPLPTSMGAV